MSNTAATKSTRPLKRDAKGIFVPMSRERLKQVDAYREQLGMSRGGAVKAILDTFGDDSLAAHMAARDADEAAAESIQPVADAVLALADAWTQRAHQRQAVGVNINQDARFANALLASIRHGRHVDGADVQRLADAIAACNALLPRQFEAELEDQALVKQLRDLVTEWVSRR